MPFDPQHPLNLDGQLQAGRLLEMAEQAAQAGGSMTANGHYAQTPQGLLFCPDVPVEAGGEVEPGDPFQIYATNYFGTTAGWVGGILDIDADYTVTITDNHKLVNVDATAGPVTVSLGYTSSTSIKGGFRVIVRKRDLTSNTVTIDPYGDDTIDGDTTRVLHQRGDLLELIYTAQKDITVSSESVWAALAGRPIAWTAAPSSASASGVAGQVAYDSSYLYLCVATNTWRRIAHATW